ncbi:MAG: hypothetical protein MRERV_37c021 [Mycoplasmataceae bacterium RV_VA103A]|nr:MAG: hypothetical protein MRERV_37c021 [Mycoplasmataceae bacterium RV_VA103A]
MKFAYHKTTNRLFNEDQEIIPARYDEKGNPYFVFPDSSAHWIKLHLTPKGNVKKIFYKQIYTYYLRNFLKPRKDKILTFTLEPKHEVIKRITGWEPKHKKKLTKKNWII